MFTEASIGRKFSRSWHWRPSLMELVLLAWQSLKVSYLLAPRTVNPDGFVCRVKNFPDFLSSEAVAGFATERP